MQINCEDWRGEQSFPLEPLLKTIKLVILMSVCQNQKAFHSSHIPTCMMMKSVENVGLNESRTRGMSSIRRVARVSSPGLAQLVLSSDTDIMCSVSPGP